MATDLPHTGNSPAACMDRLSDRLGSLIPGGYRLPPRHPVKVSLVMGILGWITGWLMCLSFLGIRSLERAISAHEYPAIVLVVVTGFFSLPGLGVLVPLCLWGGRRWPAAACSLLFAVLPYPVLQLWSSYAIRQGWFPIQRPTWESFWFFAGLFAISAASHVLGIVLLLRRNVWAVLITTTVTSSLIAATLLEGVLAMDSVWLVGLFRASLVYGMVATVCLAILAICLGIALWDTTPRAVFEP